MNDFDFCTLSIWYSHNRSNYVSDNAPMKGHVREAIFATFYRASYLLTTNTFITHKATTAIMAKNPLIGVSSDTMS
jgi:hypothetical protein